MSACETTWSATAWCHSVEACGKPRRGQLWPDGGLTCAAGKPQAMGALGKDMKGVPHVLRRERSGQRGHLTPREAGV